MKYPKKVMTIAELTKTDNEDPEQNIGFPKEYLRSICRNRKINKIFHIAWKEDEGKATSPYLIDTEALEKYRQSKCTGE